MSDPRHYVVLGAGMQGVAAAFDLARHGGAASVRLVDRERGRLAEAQDRLARADPAGPYQWGTEDLESGAAIQRALLGAHGVLSALPYRLNPIAAEAAVAAGVHYTDLGGHTGRVREILQHADRAAQQGISLVPDAGIAPGTANILAALAAARHASVQEIKIVCGGLPEDPVGPMNYDLVFSVEGLINEYSGECAVLREGQLSVVDALTESEGVEWPGRGPLEAFATSGGSSLAPETFAGRLRTYEYKTLRYPGHLDQIRFLRDLGAFDESMVELEHGGVVPRKLTEALLVRALKREAPRDLLLLRVQGFGAAGLIQEFLVEDRVDDVTGFTAMERCTAFSAALGLAEQVAGHVAPGAWTPERAFDGERILKGLRTRGISIRDTRM